MSKDTLQLPKTAFSMKASLPLKEPEILKNGKKIKFLINLEKSLAEKKSLYFMMAHLMRTVIYIWAPR